MLIHNTLTVPATGSPFADPPPSPPTPTPSYGPSIFDQLPPPPSDSPFQPSYNLLTILCIVAITLIFIPFLIYSCLYGSCCRRHVWRRYRIHEQKRQTKKELKREELRRHEQQQQEERQRETEFGGLGQRMRSLSESMRGPWRTRGVRSFTWSAGQDLGNFGRLSGDEESQIRDQGQLEFGPDGWRSRRPSAVASTQPAKKRKWWWQVWFSRSRPGHKSPLPTDSDGASVPYFNEQVHFPSAHHRHQRSFLANLFSPPNRSTHATTTNNIPSTTDGSEEASPRPLRLLSPRPIVEDDTFSRVPTFDSLDTLRNESDLATDIDESSTIRHTTRKVLPTMSQTKHPQLVPVYARITKPQPIALKPVSPGDALEEQPTSLQSQRNLDLQQRAAFRSISAPSAIIYRPPTITRKVHTSQHEDHAMSLSSGGTTPLDASVPNYSALFAQGLTRRLEYLEEPVVMRQTLGLSMPPMGSTPISGITVNQDPVEIEQFVAALRRKLEWWKGQTTIGNRVGQRDRVWDFPTAEIVGEESNGYFVGQVPAQLEPEEKKFPDTSSENSKENSRKARGLIYGLHDARSKPRLFSHSRMGTDLSFRTALSCVSINECYDSEGEPQVERGRTKSYGGFERRGQKERYEGNTDYSEVVLKYGEKGRIASEREHGSVG